MNTNIARHIFSRACIGFLCLFYVFFVHFAQAQDSQSSLNLTAALQQAYKNNPTLMAARQKLEQTLELYPQARAGWLPSVNAESSVYSTEVRSSNFGTGGDGATTKDVSLNLNQPVWRGGRTSAEIARANNLIRASEADLQQTEQQIFLKTMTAYMNVLRDRELVTLRKDNESILQTELKAVQERRDLGDTTVTNVNQAAARYARAQAETLDVFGDLGASESEFLEITGVSPPAGLAASDIHFDFPVGMEEMTQLAETANPELQSAKFEQQAAEHSIDAVSSEQWPQLSAYASYNKQYDPQPGLIADSETKTVGLKASVALYEGGAMSSRIREAQKAAKRGDYQIEETRQRIAQEIFTNWNLYRAAQAETRSREAEIKAADLALTGVREEARLGQRTLMDVLDADQDLIDAKVALAHAHRDEAVAEYSLAASLGLLSPDHLHITDAQEK